MKTYSKSMKTQVVSTHLKRITEAHQMLSHNVPVSGKNKKISILFGHHENMPI